MIKANALDRPCQRCSADCPCPEVVSSDTELRIVCGERPISTFRDQEGSQCAEDGPDGVEELGLPRAVNSAVAFTFMVGLEKDKLEPLLADGGGGEVSPLVSVETEAFAFLFRAFGPRRARGKSKRHYSPDSRQFVHWLCCPEFAEESHYNRVVTIHLSASGHGRVSPMARIRTWCSCLPWLRRRHQSHALFICRLWSDEFTSMERGGLDVGLASMVWSEAAES